MIFLAAMTAGDLTNEDFLRYVGCNPVHAKMEVNGKIELAGRRVPEGHLNQFIWRMRDENVSSADITVVIIFNQTREKHRFEEYQFELSRREPEIADFLQWLRRNTGSKQTDMAETDEGNLVFTLRDCATDKLSEMFSVHSRKSIQSV